MTIEGYTWISRNRSQRCVGVAREKVSGISMRTIRQRSVKRIIPRGNPRYHAIGIMTMVKIERKEEGRVIKIAPPNTGSTSDEEKTEIPETEERKTDRMMIMRGISMTASEKIEGEERNDEIGTGIVIREEVTVKTDQKGEAGETTTAIGEEIRAKRDRRGEVEGTSTAIGSVDIVIMRGKGPRRTRMIRDTGTDHISIKENGERER